MTDRTSTEKRGLPKEAPLSELSPLLLFRRRGDLDHLADRVAHDRRAAGHQRADARRLGRRPLDEDVGQLLRQASIEDVLASTCLRRGDALEVDAVLALDAGEERHCNAGG